MWCRALLGVIALTYILCVFILNGLQKEDLDVSTLRKLQRHNVNIDDMNNETLQSECKTVRNELVDFNKSDETISSDLGDKKEDPKKLSDSNLQNIIINYYNNVQRTSKTNDSQTLESKQSPDLHNIQNFITLWDILSKMKDNTVVTQSIESTTLSLKVTNRQHKLSDDTDIEYINKILENFIASHKMITTNRPTTKQAAYDILSQKIQEILANSRNKDKLKPFVTQSTDFDEYSTDKVNEEIEVLRNDSIRYINDNIKITQPFEISRHVNDLNTSHRKIRFKDTQVPRRILEGEVDPAIFTANSTNENIRDDKRGATPQLKTLSEDIIKEISESVKAKVLRDLKIIISTTTNNPASTLRTTTTVRPQKTTTVDVKHEENQPKTDADLLEKVMIMLQQLKAEKNTEPLIINKGAEETNIKTIHSALTKITDPETAAENLYDIKPHPLNLKSVIINPYNPMNTPVIQTILPNDPYALLNLKTPMQNIAKPDHKITQFNIFNTKNNFHPSPVKLQTNSFEIAPLGLPAQQSVVYQNIVVTTKHPLGRVRHDYLHQSYTSPNEKRYGDNNHKDRLPLYSPQQSRTRYEPNIGGHERSREFIDEYFKEKDYLSHQSKRKPIKYRDYSRTHYNDHNSQRYHEKLERAEDWPRMSQSGENWHIDYSTPKFTSRHQIPLSDAKKRPRNDDAPFRNFLHTQQKVNDMLERILATKTKGPRSVEIID